MRSGARVLEVDFNYKQSLLEAMTGVRCVFLHTHYWEMYSRTLEVWHGQCVVEAAVTANVEHIVYDGTTYVKPSDGLMCGFLASRLEIEEIIVRSGISYTIVVFPFVLENLLTVFRPFEVSKNLYALPLPMEYNLLPVGGLNDMAICVCKIFLQLRNVRRVKLFLATQMLTVSQIASTLTSVLREKRFFDPEDNRLQFLRVLNESKETPSMETFLSVTRSSISIPSKTPSMNFSNSAAVSAWATSFLKTRGSLGPSSDPSSTSPNSPPRDAVSPRRTGATTKKRRFRSLSDSNLKESGQSLMNPSCGRDLTWPLSGVNVGESDCNHLDTIQFDKSSPSGVASTTSLPSNLSLVSFERAEPWTDESQIHI
ncbi:hypothetical protein C0Q70_12768 [Pomacea canaliculata]|uniref:NmrA-like family domain-containing protein 1 n=1 Tax=Pomacea canaliculata TaxID=400727 RepID=A0A2T7P2G5_POMCA|nr:hypothetical protein C0Q70_12768 [Pomacea canaliculata]